MRYALAALVTVTALVAASTARADTTITRDVYTNFVMYTCTGEDVLFEGTIQFRDGSHVDPQGGMHGTSMMVIYAFGIGQTSGLQYHLTSVNPFAVNFFDPNGGSTGHLRLRVVQQGGGVITEDLETHVTITPDGDFVLIRFDFTFDCRGHVENFGPPS